MSAKHDKNKNKRFVHNKLAELKCNQLRINTGNILQDKLAEGNIFFLGLLSRPNSTLV